jgi:hypothetical protein
MHVNVTWQDNAKTLVRIQLLKGWTWNEVKQALRQVDEMIASVPHTVNVLIDLREGGGIPRDFLAVAGELLHDGEARPNEGEKVVIGANFLMKTAYRGFQSLYKNKLENRPIYFADSVENAQALLQQHTP